MILDTFEPAAYDFGSLNPRLNAALTWARNSDLASLPDGIVEVEGRKIYAIAATYDTQPPENKRFEAHRAYLDIQIVASGEETLYWQPLAGLPEVTAEYDPTSDKILFADPKESVAFVLRPGSYAIFFPNDGHKASCIAGAPCGVKKVTMKVSL